MQDSPICSSGMRILYRKIPFRPPDNSPFKTALNAQDPTLLFFFVRADICHSFYYTLLFSIGNGFSKICGILAAGIYFA